MIEDVRSTEQYKDACCAAVGLGPVPDERYAHLDNPADIALLQWTVRRGSACMALPDTPRTSVRGFLHRLITIGGPVKTTLHRLSATDTAWIEQAVQEDVARGQLTRGNSAWGSPGFPTKESLAHKGIKRKRRMVVDYRGVNRVTVKKKFMIPDSNQIKANVAGSKWLSVGDLKEGFNQVDNEPETSKKLAVIVASGSYLPRGLTFGPTNGPEDFQEMVFIVFARWLYKRWFLFLDDLTVATGRPEAAAPGPSGAEDVIASTRQSSLPFRNSRSYSAMGLRATAFAGSVVGAEGAAPFNGAVSVNSAFVGAMLLMCGILVFLVARFARGRLPLLRSLGLYAQLLTVEAIDVDAIQVVVISTAAMLTGSGWVYGTGKVMQIGQEAIDATADLGRSTIETGKLMTETIVEDSAWGLSMTVRTILAMLAIAVVCCAGKNYLQWTIAQ